MTTTGTYKARAEKTEKEKNAGTFVGGLLFSVALGSTALPFLRTNLPEATPKPATCETAKPMFAKPTRATVPSQKPIHFNVKGKHFVRLMRRAHEGDGTLDNTPVQKMALTRSIIIGERQKYNGWDRGTEWKDLKLLWARESSWNAKARNPSSGAIGLPQLLPGVHRVPNGFRRSARVQIEWGLNYIRSRYGPHGPIRAWAHERTHSWY